MTGMTVPTYQWRWRPTSHTCHFSMGSVSGRPDAFHRILKDQTVP